MMMGPTLFVKETSPKSDTHPSPQLPSFSLSATEMCDRQSALEISPYVMSERVPISRPGQWPHPKAPGPNYLASRTRLFPRKGSGASRTSSPGLIKTLRSSSTETRAVFMSGESEDVTAIKKELTRVKNSYKGRLYSKFQQGNAKEVWRGMKEMMGIHSFGCGGARTSTGLTPFTPSGIGRLTQQPSSTRSVQTCGRSTTKHPFQ